MSANKVVMNTENGEEVLIDLTGDSVTPQTLAEGETSHDASGNIIRGTMPTDVVRYGAQTLTDTQKSQARENIGAANQEEVNQLSQTIADYGTQIDNKLNKNHGSANVGKILMVGSDGNLVLTAMPEASGDVVGVFDENKNLLLSGDIADGTYPLKWKLDDGTYADAGTLTVSRIVAPQYTNILTSGDYDIQLNKRWSASGKAFSDCNGMIAFKIPVSDVLNKTIRFKGFTEGLTSGSNKAWWYLLDSSNTRLVVLAGTSDGGGSVWQSSYLSYENGVYSIPINSTTFSQINNGAWVVIQMAVYSSTAIATLPDNLIMTIDEEIL